MYDTSNMSPGARKLRDFYAIKPNAGIHQQEFGFYTLDRWKEEGHLAADVTQDELDQLFGFDPPGLFNLGGLGWCEGGFNPPFEEKWIRDEGSSYEIIQDFAGRHVKFFKGRRNGFMPEYVDHPVKDQKTWEEQCKWRLDPRTPDRYPRVAETVAAASQAEREGKVICQNLVGGYMYLRSLMGPLELMYLLYDDPALVHDCMRTWFDLADAIIARHQEHVTIDDIYIGEDICYNHGLLISKDMVREFLFPYYQQLLANAKKRQLDQTRHLYFHLDTDGFSDEALPLYQEIGMDYLSPFEVASGCDVVRTGLAYPELLISGGFDKRIIAAGKEAIDREIERIMPVMYRRGGYIPTCDHGVPEEVSFTDYLHFRKRMLEFAR